MPGTPTAPPQRRKFGLPPSTPPIPTAHDNWSSQELAYAICGGVKGNLGHADASNAEAAHRAWMEVVKLLPTHTLAGLYNAAFPTDTAEDGFWQEESREPLASRLLRE